MQHLALAPAARACSTSYTAPRQQRGPRRAFVVAAGALPGSGGQQQVRASRIPPPDEDKEVMHNAFMNAYGQSHHGPRITGMQEFAGALLARQRIPSSAYSDPLGHIFDEFDRDKSGTLSATEVAEALRSRNVNITDEQAAMFVDAVDMESHAINRDEFRELILHMAAADLHSRRVEHAAGQAQGEEDGDWIMSSWEQDDEIVGKLKDWTDNIMTRRFK